MVVKKKLMLLKYTDIYWTLLPAEIKEMILKYKESQELIERRESFSSRGVCLQIEAYGLLRREWFIGPVQCKLRRPKTCQCRLRCAFWMIYRHYWDLDGDRKRVFIDFNFRGATVRCDSIKKRIAV